NHCTSDTASSTDLILTAETSSPRQKRKQSATPPSRRKKQAFVIHVKDSCTVDMSNQDSSDLSESSSELRLAFMKFQTTSAKLVLPGRDTSTLLPEVLMAKDEINSQITKGVVKPMVIGIQVFGLQLNMYVMTMNSDDGLYVFCTAAEGFLPRSVSDVSGTGFIISIFLHAKSLLQEFKDQLNNTEFNSSDTTNTPTTTEIHPERFFMGPGQKKAVVSTKVKKEGRGLDVSFVPDSIGQLVVNASRLREIEAFREQQQQWLQDAFTVRSQLLLRREREKAEQAREAQARIRHERMQARVQERAQRTQAMERRQYLRHPERRLCAEYQLMMTHEAMAQGGDIQRIGPVTISSAQAIEVNHIRNSPVDNTAKRLISSDGSMIHTNTANVTMGFGVVDRSQLVTRKVEGKTDGYASSAKAELM
ncbi:hypothetical protein BGZ46_004374, partial [Entomortierella lignicola]